MDAMFLAEAIHNETLANIGVSSYHKIIQNIINIVEQSQGDGAVPRDLSATAVAQVLFSLVQGMSSQMIMTGEQKPLDIDAYLKATLAVISGELFNVNN
jgi:hypothetical protein